MNHLDTAGKLKEIKLCSAYDVNGQIKEYFSSNLDFLKAAKPIYETFEGDFDIAGLTDYDKLPLNAKKYVEAVEDITKTPIEFIGTGPKRDDIITRKSKTYIYKM